jgi:hypothetical protein
MTSGQRWIAVVALGACCWVTASTLNTWLDWRHIDGGWFNYAPNNGVVFSPASGNPWRSLGVWIAAILLWFGLSYLLLRNVPKDQ